MAEPLAQQKQAQATSRLKAKANARTRSHANLLKGKLGFISAKQIPAGGWTYWDAAEGDFNGDGKPDVATIVENYDSTNQVTSILSLLF